MLTPADILLLSRCLIILFGCSQHVATKGNENVAGSLFWNKEVCYFDRGFVTLPVIIFAQLFLVDFMTLEFETVLCQLSVLNMLVGGGGGTISVIYFIHFGAARVWKDVIQLFRSAGFAQSDIMLHSLSCGSWLCKTLTTISWDAHPCWEEGWSQVQLQPSNQLLWTEL